MKSLSNVSLFGCGIFSICFLLIGSPSAFGQGSTLPKDWVEQVKFRSVGPATMSGRITSIAVHEKDPNIWWAASASGGLIKTINNGHDFEHQFDDQSTVSIGDVQVSQNDPNLVWVGTGEANPRNSVSWGDGVYKSTDGGATWKNMGLKKTFQTGRMAIHPKDDDVVFVGSLGRLWGPNEERGLFKTTDGGKTWKKILYVDDKTGVIDVQLNPKNPDEMLVATYERQRDGFDGNDPMTKYGEGSGVYKSTDGGETFERISKGLPSCKLGRIGLSYYRKDPKYVVALIESEKIAKRPENAAYADFRAEDAEGFGARITRVTGDGNAEKSGLKEDDIVISVDGNLVHSKQDLDKEIRSHKAGDVVKMIVSRDRKTVDVEMELGKYPKPRTSSRRSGRSRSPSTEFTGTLGGQAANLQGQQGNENEEEYGGVYLSKDGGSSWKRINTLNPRPMYYSQIRVDPTDRKNMYVLGTSLYRSKDGGETFTGDGGSDGIHVDHHALWIDPTDGRHMILGNDGGIHITNDRMENWDHQNHVAIGQFYHVGLDTRDDYHVFGGMQDNGSWGGPAHVTNDSGPVNTDWYRVGGGDGFVTLVDPNDSDQIYYESQNGGMGSINLRTGARGFIRPQTRGVRYRFNWKTPFLLSPHNSQIHYSAGNHVFKSVKKGSGVKAISPDITNSDKGAGSALTESPREPGVLYVGTTDGAVWMTKDGGNNWTPLYSVKKEEEEESGKTEESSNGSEKRQRSGRGDRPVSNDDDGRVMVEKSSEGKKPEGSSPAKSTEKPAVKDLVSGSWSGVLISDRFPEGQAPRVSLELKLESDGKVTGEVESRRGSSPISEGKFDSEKNELTLVIDGERGSREYTAKVNGDEMSGEMTAGNGQFTVEFSVTRKKNNPQSVSSVRVPMLPTASALMSGLLTAKGQQDEENAVAGTWECVVENENLPDGRIEFTLMIELDDENKITGELESPQGTMDIEEGEFNPKNNKIFFMAENEQFALDFEATVDGKTMSGDMAAGNGQMTADFMAKQIKAAKARSAKSDKKQADKVKAEKAEADKAKAEKVKADKAKADKVKADKAKADKAKADKAKADKAKADKAKADKAKAEKAKAEKKKSDNERETADKTQDAEATSSNQDASTEVATVDSVSGKWTGMMISRQGERDLTVELTWKSNKEITGTYATDRFDGDITEGTFNPKTKELSVLSDSGQFTLEFVGKVEDGNFEGEAEFNGGTFSMEFELKRTGAAKVVETKPETSPDKEGEKAVENQEEEKDEKTTSSLAEMMPGPRWVSSLSASKFNAGRCYISFDGHRSNDDEPYLFVTEDYGKNWKSIRGNLPTSAGSVRVLREDPVSENLLFLGCEFGAWVSVDRGGTWSRLADLPTVAVHEFAFHPTSGEVVVGTHGRAIWIGDISGLRQFNEENIAKDAVLYKPNKVIRWRRGAERGSSGTRKFTGENRSASAALQYSLGKSARDVQLMVTDVTGSVVREFDELEAGKGLHTVDWDLRRASNNQGRGSGGRGGSRRGFGGPTVPTGTYLVTLKVDGQTFKETLQVVSDPNAAADALPMDEELEFWLEFGEGDDD